MPKIPAFCENCKSFFIPADENAIFVDNVTIISSGNRVPCPECRSMATVLEGELNVRNGLFEVLSAPDITVDVLKRVGLLLQLSAEAGEGPEEAAKRIESVSPSVAMALLQTHKRTPTTIFVAIIAALGYILAHIGEGAASGAGEAIVHHFIDKPPSQSEQPCTLTSAQKNALIEEIMHRLTRPKHQGPVWLPRS